MSKETNEAAILGACVVLAIIAFFTLLWGLFVYNNNQNIKRDEFISQHCSKTSDVSNGWGGTNYQCGNTK